MKKKRKEIKKKRKREYTLNQILQGDCSHEFLSHRNNNILV